MQIANLSLLILEGFTAAVSSASSARQVVAFFFCLVPGGYVVSKPVVPPRIRKTSLGAATFRQSQRSEVSTPV